MAEYRLITDGGCKKPGSPGGWAFILYRMSDNEKWATHGSSDSTTSNKMEMTAVCRGLSLLANLNIFDADVQLISDSKYIVDGIGSWLKVWRENDWRRRDGKLVSNIELWKIVSDLCDKQKVKATWIPGHTGHPDNEECDRMAKEAMERCIYRLQNNKCPYDPSELRYTPLGMFHCPWCGEMQLAGVPHIDYDFDYEEVPPLDPDADYTFHSIDDDFPIDFRGSD